MPDANQWELVDAGDELLLAFYRALEKHAIQRATNNTGSMVITLKKQLGESTKGVRTASTRPDRIGRRRTDRSFSTAPDGITSER